MAPFKSFGVCELCLQSVLCNDLSCQLITEFDMRKAIVRRLSQKPGFLDRLRESLESDDVVKGDQS